MSFAVHLEGRGVATTCCARLLAAKGIHVTSSGGIRSTLPAILLNTATLRLLRDIVPEVDLTSNSRAIRTRVVQWGIGSTPVRLPHAGLVISEQALLEELSSTVATGSEPTRSAIEWRVFCTSDALRSAHPHTYHNFGDRLASLAVVTLQDDTDPYTCWVESLREGWLFLLPTHSNAATLIATGLDPQELLKASQLIAPLLAGVSSPFISAPAHPRIADPLCGPGWLSCGSAALAFDPLCGEGTGHAVREAILASAVLRRLKSGADRDPSPLLHHFRQRMIAGIRKHLETCGDFYESGGDSPWWTTQLASLDTGLQWTREQLSLPGGQPFRLVDFDLQPCG